MIGKTPVWNDVELWRGRPTVASTFPDSRCDPPGLVDIVLWEVEAGYFLIRQQPVRRRSWRVFRIPNDPGFVWMAVVTVAFVS